MDVQKTIISVILLGFLCLSLQAQVCDPSVAPTGLTSTYTPGIGVLLMWDVVPGSVGVQVKVNSLTDGTIFTRRNIVFERDGILIPEDRFSPGNYTWQVQAACSTVFPYHVTPISVPNEFTLGGAVACPATVTDYDGNVYSTVQLGTQCWTQENLRVERYSNGDAMLTGLSNSVWETTTSGAFSAYEDVASNKAIYGLLYNWYAVNDARGLCPVGWHVPTDAEWTQLTDLLGGEGVAGGQMKTTGTLGTGTGLWLDPNGDATNSSGFSGLPGGYRDFSGNYNYQGFYSSLWSSSQTSTINAWSRLLLYANGIAYRSLYNKHYGFSVRCLRDE